VPAENKDSLEIVVFEQEEVVVDQGALSLSKYKRARSDRVKGGRVTYKHALGQRAHFLPVFVGQKLFVHGDLWGDPIGKENLKHVVKLVLLTRRCRFVRHKVD